MQILPCFALLVACLAVFARGYDEILCDGLTYDGISDRQGGAKTIYDGCTNSLGKFAGYPVGSGPTDQAVAAVTPDDDFLVEKNDKWWAFRLKNSDVVTDGVVIIPGGNVDAASYAVLARAVVSGMKSIGLKPLAVIPRYSSSEYRFDPCNVLSNDPSAKTITTVRGVYGSTTLNSLNANVTRWVVGGHSEGGPATAGYFSSLYKKGQLDETTPGGYMLGSFPGNSMQYMPSSVQFMSIFGGDNLGVSLQTYTNAKANLFPNQTIYHDFQNGFDTGIHSYMGAYCPLTPGSSGTGGELQYYETAPDPTVHPLEITRDKQTKLVSGWLVQLMSCAFLGKGVDCPLVNN